MNKKLPPAKVIPALPPLVEKGEVFDEKTYEDNFYIDKLGEIKSIAISQDGKYIVSMSSSYTDGSIKIWERESGKLLEILESTSQIESLAISQDSKYIVSGASDGNIRIWERKSGKLFKILKGHTDAVNSVAISQDTKYIVSR